MDIQALKDERRRRNARYAAPTRPNQNIADPVVWDHSSIKQSISPCRWKGRGLGERPGTHRAVAAIRRKDEADPSALLYCGSTSTPGRYPGCRKPRGQRARVWSAFPDIGERSLLRRRIYC